MLKDMHKWFVKYGNDLPTKNVVVHLRKKSAFQIAQDYANTFKYVEVYKRTYADRAILVAGICNGYKQGKAWDEG